MKKILLLFAVFAGVSFGSVASASLWNYYSEQGSVLPSIEQRTGLYKNVGSDVYVGSTAQNKALEAYLRAGVDEIVLGGTPAPTSSAAIQYVEAPDFFAYSPAVAGDTSITLNNLVDIYGNVLTMANFGNIGYGRIDPDGKNVSESFTFSGVTANSDGTYTLTGVKTALAKYPYTQTTGLVRSHSINAIVRFTNTAAFYDNFANKENNEIVDGIWHFTQLPTSTTATPTDDSQLATKGYADSLSFAGAPDASQTVKGIVEQATGAEAAANTPAGGGGTTAPLGVTTDITSSTSPGTGNIVPVTNSNGRIDSSFCNGAYSCADTDANGLVVPNPASATSTPTADAIVMASSTGLVDGGWIPNASLFGATATTSLGNVIITSGTTTLTADAYYNNLTIQTGAVLDPDGYRVFVKNTLTFEGTGKIANNGGNGGAAGIGVASAAGSAGTLANATGTLPASLPGKAGGVGDETNCTNGAQGGAGVASTKSLGVAGSEGGAGGPATAGQTCSTSQRAGGSAGTLSSTIVDYPYNPFKAFFLFDLFPTYASFNGSASSGGGSGGVGGAVAGQLGGGGGGSGASGGSVWVAAQRIVTVDGNNYIEAKGGNGGAGASSGGSVSGAGGGGAGGPGGWVILIYHTKTGTGTISVAGGTAGANGAIGNQGTSAVAGLTGKTYVMQTQ